MTYSDDYNIRETSVTFNDVADAIDGTLTRNAAGTTSGTSTAYVASPTPAWTEYVNGSFIVITPHTDNAGPCTINVSNLGTKDIKRAGQDLNAGILVANFPTILVYNGVYFEILLQNLAVQLLLRADGSNSPTANLPMGGYKHTGVANASSNDEYVALGQISGLSIAKNGSNTPTANLPMGGYKHTGVANASSNNEYTTWGQLKDNSFTAELEALEIAPTSANLALDVTAKSGATGVLVNFERSTAVPIFRVENDGQVGINTTSFAAGSVSALEIRAPNGSSTGGVATSMYSLIGNDEAIAFQIIGTRSGGALRQSILGLYKHSGITECCAYLFLESANSTNNYVWFDDAGIMRVGGNLSLVGTTSGTVIGTQTSDERLKNIEPDFGYGLEQVKALKPIAYVRKDDPEQVRRIGFGAQTTKPIVPEAVYDTKEEIEGEDPAETKLAMDYTSLIPVLVKAIQELEAKVASLEAQVAGEPES